MTRIHFPLPSTYASNLYNKCWFRLCTLHTSGFSKPGGFHSLAIESKANKLIDTVFTWDSQVKAGPEMLHHYLNLHASVRAPPPQPLPAPTRPAQTPNPAPALAAPLNKAEKTTCVKEEPLSVMSLLGNEITRNPALQITHSEDHFPHAARQKVK